MNTFLVNLNKKRFENESGNATIEYTLIISLIIIAVFSSVSHGISAVKSQFVASSCRMNCIMLESRYEEYLSNRGVKHSENLFRQFQESYDEVICSENCEVTYYNGDVICNGHYKDKQIDGGNDLNNPIPFL